MVAAYEALQEAEALRLAGQLEGALDICTELVAKNPDYWAARHTLGLIHQDMQQEDEALDHLLRATVLNPNNVSSLTALAGVCLATGAREAAEAAIARATALAPQDANVHFLQGEYWRETGRFDLAAKSYRRASEADEALHNAVYKRGLCLLELGQREAAIGLFREAATLDPTMLGPIYELASFPPDQSGIDVFPLLDALQKPPHMSAAAFGQAKSFGFAAAWHSLGAHERAWSHFVAANRVADTFLRAEARIVSLAQKECLARLSTIGRVPIEAAAGEGQQTLFIMGCSRSGKTTAESLLGAQAMVHRGFETDIVQDCLQHITQENGLLPAETPSLLPLQLRDAFAQQYQMKLMGRSPDAKIFTNTNPLLIADVPKLLSFIGGAKVILIKRDVEDTCFRIYAQEYQAGNAYAYNLNSIREHIVWYHLMIDLLHDLYPEVTRVLHYEDMVREPATALRTIADLCGVSFDAAPPGAIGDDTGCSRAYRTWMAFEAQSTPA